jgi:hypothetical protein
MKLARRECPLTDRVFFASFASFAVQLPFPALLCDLHGSMSLKNLKKSRCGGHTVEWHERQHDV